jgi:hypothetical protein
MHNQSAVANAVSADRERSAAVVGLPEAKGREALARHLALTGLSVDQAKAALSAAPIDPATTSAMWDDVLASRGMTTGERVLAAASPWDDVLRAKGMGA